MLEEIKRISYLGDLRSVYELACIAIKKEGISLKSITSICAVSITNNVKIKPCLSLLKEIGLISELDGYYTGTDKGLLMIKEGFSSFTENISKETLMFLINNDYIRFDSVTFDIQTKLFKIKRSGIPLVAAALRNYLIDSNALLEEGGSFFVVNKGYESLFEEQVKSRKKKISLEQLMRTHELQQEQGRLAEEFILIYENKRLTGSNKVAKQISDIDVTAGYDIVSYDSPKSNEYDRFIEVKSYNGSVSFFWSANERRVAEKLGERYYLYLVDMEKYEAYGYTPIIICNPINNILGSDNWFVETENVKVTRI